MKRLIAILKLSALLLSGLPFTGISQTNIALNRPATASSVQSGSSYTANLAVDGNTGTRWSSNSTDNEWIYVDLGSQYNITNVNITWETALGKNYTIDVSNDASTWTTIKTITGNTSTSNSNSVSGTGRYVRVHGTLRGTTFGYSIWELTIFGTAASSGTNIAQGRPGTASSVQSGSSYTAGLAFDGNTGTRWSSASTDNEWIYVDLGSQYNITNVNITWETAYGKNYTIDVSNDASTWTTIKTITGNASTTNNNSVSGTGRYVRMHGTLRGSTFGYSIWEMQVLGSATSGGSSGGGSGGSSGGGTTGGSGSGTMSTSGKTYYVSATDGNDNNTSAQAQSSSTPWKTISKVNSFFSSLNAGDQIAFKRGDTFYGTLTVNKSGTSSAPILVGAYGSGANPIITGLTTVSSWTSVGSNRYTATVSGGLSTCNIVTRDGNFQAMGKMPKGNSGYYTASGGSTSSLSSSGISGIPSYVGGEVVWRAQHWVLWRGTVTSQTSTSVNFNAFASTSGGSVEPARASYGFFFQNSPNACTQAGEWAYNSSHVLTMYFSDATTSHTVQAATLDQLVSASGVSYVSFNNITFRGANSYIFNMLNCNNITINGCSLFFAGIYGIYGNGTGSNWTITNNNINWSNSIGILATSSTQAWKISGNTISNSGATAGMGGSGEGQYFGIKGPRNGSTITGNSVLNTGYDPIMFEGTNNLVQNNYIDYFGFVKDDAGGIYCGAGQNLTGSKILNNIITRGIGNPPGTPDKDMRAQGIYVDDGANNVEIGYNTVASCGVSGIYCHNASYVNMHNNTLYNNSYCSIAMYNDGNTTKNITYTNNINFAKTSSQLVYETSGGSTSPGGYYTSLDNNHYCRPVSETSNFQLYVPSTSMLTLAAWKTLTGKDPNSKASPKTVSDTSQIKFFYNPTNSAASFSFSGTYVDVFGTSYTSTVTLQPWTSVVLMYSSGSTTKAEVNTTEVVNPAALSPVNPVFVLYPNPVSDNFSVELTNDQTGQMKVDIVSVSGQIMRSLMLNKEQQSTQFSLPSNNLSKGVYFIQVQVGNWNGTKRFVKL